MPEIRVESPRNVVDVLDAYCIATGRHRTDVVNEVLGKWAEEKKHEATIICRVAGCNPSVAEGCRK